MAKNNSNSIAKTVNFLLKEIAPRNRDIISRRFGLKTGKKETLESIGKGYGITRERVRQIEDFTLKQLAKVAEGNPEVSAQAEWARSVMANRGGVVREADLFQEFSGQAGDSAANAALVLVLTASGKLVRSNDSDDFNAFWAESKQKAETFKSTVASLVKAFEKAGKVVAESELASFIEKNGVSGINKEHIETTLAVSKNISKNIFGQVGLVSWAEVKPRGVKDKAYLALKKFNAPRHFAEIASFINDAGFSAKKANVQTVHNELIKDKRFVLIGRGIYALSEWGYSTGTVKDVLVDVLKKNAKPMTKAQLVAKVMDLRMVKENTVLLNLQDAKIFRKNEDGTYVLKKA